MPNPTDLNERLRRATSYEPDTERALARVTTRVQRQERRRRTGMAVALVTVSGLAAFFLLRSPEPDDSVLVGPSPTTTDAYPTGEVPVLAELWSVPGVGMSGSFSASGGDLIASTADAVVVATGFGAGDGGWITAVERDTGEVRWSTELGGPAFLQGATESTVVANTQEGLIVGLNVLDGTVRWDLPLAQLDLDGYGAVTSAIAEPLSAIGLSASNEGDVRPPVILGVDTDTGEVAWTTPLEDGTDLMWGTPPVADGQTVFASTLSHPGSAEENSAHLIDLAEGSVLWAVGMGSGQGFSDDPPVFDGSYVHLPARQGVLTVNRDDGSVEWTQPGRGALLVDGELWTIQPDGRVARLDPATGETLATLDSPVENPTQLLDLGTDALGIVSYANIAGIDADGRVALRGTWPASLVDSARIDGDLILVATADSALAAYSIDASRAPGLSEATTNAEPVGRLEIPAIDVDVMFVEGMTTEDLKHGPGHYPETPPPGQFGNSAIAGHRTTYGAPFNRLDELEPGDEIVIWTAERSFTYEVRETLIVEPSALEVLGPTFWSDRWGQGPASTITLTTETPKFSSTQRLVVGAELTGEPTGDASPRVGPTSTRLAPG